MTSPVPAAARDAVAIDTPEADSGSTSLRTRTAVARQRLVDHLTGRVGADGDVHDRCGSRILESALLLSLLRKQQKLPTVQDGLTGYLRQAPAGGPLDAGITAAALGRPSDPAPLMDYLDNFRHFTGARKRLLLRTVLEVLDVLPASAQPDPRTIRYGAAAIWTDLSLCSIRILRCRALYHDVDAADLDYLTMRLRAFTPARVWEGNALAHLIALHALHAGRPDHPLLADGVAALARVLNRDGGMPFIDGQQVWITALAATALTGAHAPQKLLTTMGDYLAGRQQSDGGWGYNDTTSQTDVDDTSRCMLALRQIDPTRYLRAQHAAQRYLADMADPGGGFPTYLRGHDPEVDLTAGAILALAPVWERYAPVLDASAEFILDSQHADGTFDTSWTISESSVIGHVLQALDHIPSAPSDHGLASGVTHAVSKAVSHLGTTQNQDGGWGQRPDEPSDILATAHAIPAIARSAPLPLQLAVSHLLANQHPDGGFSAHPDQVGPRPFPYNYTSLT